MPFDAAAALLALAAAFAPPLRGIVTDPVGRVVPGARVEATCASQRTVVVTNRDGVFAVDAASTLPCRLVITKDGFEPREMMTSDAFQERMPVQIRLEVARRRETVDVQATRTSLSAAALGAVTSAAMDRQALRIFGGDMTRALTVLERAAGTPLGRFDLRADGVSIARPPSPDSTDSIAIAPDPFSAESSGTDRYTVETSFGLAAGRWHLAARPGAFSRGGREPLLGMRAPSRERGLSGDLSVFGNGRVQVFGATTSARDVENPTYVAGQPGAEYLAADVTTASHSTVSEAGVSGHIGALRFRSGLTASRFEMDHAGVGGLAGPSSAGRLNSRATQAYVSWRATRSGWILRGSASHDDRRNRFEGLASGPGIISAGRLISGLADPAISSTTDRTTRLRAIAEGSGPVAPWMFGGESTVRRLREDRAFNAFGQSVLSSRDGAWFHRASPDHAASVEASEITAALFGQRIVVQSARRWLRIGMRADWQHRRGLLLAPRLSASALAGPFVVAGNAGVFNDSWAAEHDAELDIRAISPVVWISPARTTLTIGDRVRRRDYVARASVIRLAGPFRFAFQETLTFGHRLSGMTRHLDGSQLVDRMDATRTLTRTQSHLRIDAARGAWTGSLHYELAQSRDNTDGPFSLPALQNDLAAERGPSSAVPRHALGLVASGSAPGGVQVLVSAGVQSGRPYTLVTGADPESLLTFSGRADTTRNARRTASTPDLAIYASKRFALAVRGWFVDAGLRLEHLIGGVTVLDTDTSSSSALAGLAIRAGAGRSVSAWLTLGRQ